MGRIAKRFKSAGSWSLMGVFLLTILTCSNDVNLVQAIQDEVMNANGRYLVVNAIEMPLTDGRFSPIGTIKIIFDRPIDVSTVTPETVQIKHTSGASNGLAVEYPAEGISYLADTFELSVRVIPYLDVDSDFVLTVNGVRGTDGSRVRTGTVRSFRTRNIITGYALIQGHDASSLPGYSVTNALSVGIQVAYANFDYYRYRIDYTDDETVSEDTVWTMGTPSTWIEWNLTAGQTLVSPFMLTGVSDAVNLRVQFWGNMEATSTGQSEGIPFISTIFVDTEAPAAGTIELNSGLLYTASPIIATNFTAAPSDTGSGIKDISFSNDNSTWSTWQNYSQSLQWNVTDATAGGTSAQGVKTVYARSRDLAGNISDTVSATVTYDSTNPTAGVWSINSGSTYTTSKIISLAATTAANDPGGSGIVEMALSNNGTAWSPWEAYANSKAGWDISTAAYGGSNTEGNRTVYIKVRDNSGRESNPVSAAIFYDGFDPTNGTWVINSNSAYATAATVTVSASVVPKDTGGSGIAQMSFSNNNADWSAWETYAATKTWDMTAAAYGGTASQGTKTVYARVRDNAGRISTSVSDSVFYDSANPLSGTWSINSGATYTTSNLVTVNGISAPTDTGGSGVSQMRFSNNSELWSSWETYSTTKSNWNITDSRTGGSTTQGNRSVYIQIMDAAGRISSAASDAIFYDSANPTSGVWRINSNASYTTSLTVSINMTTAPTDTSGSGISRMSFSNDNATWSAWEAYQTAKTNWNLNEYGGSTVQGSKTVYIRISDASGRISSTTSDSIYYDTTSPSVGVWRINSNTTYANLANVTLSYTTAPSDTGSGIYQVSFSNNGTTWSDWMNYTSSYTWNMTSSTYGGNTNQGTKYVYVKVRDNSLRESTATYDAIIYDSIAPTVSSLLINAGDSSTNSTAVSLTVSASDSGSGLDVMQFANESTSSAVMAYTTAAISFSIIDKAGTRTVYMQLRDKAGNVTNAQDTIVLNARLRVTYTSLRLTETGDLTGNGEIYYTFRINGVNKLVRSEASYLSMADGATTTSGMPASYTMYVAPTGTIELTGTVYDDDSPSSDDSGTMSPITYTASAVTGYNNTAQSIGISGDITGVIYYTLTHLNP